MSKKTGNQRHIECAGLMRTGYDSFHCCDCMGSLWKRKVGLELAVQPACDLFHSKDKLKEKEQNRIEQKNNIFKSILICRLFKRIWI